MNFKPFPSALIYLVASVLAHGDHSHEPISGDAVEYAMRHVRVLAPNLCWVRTYMTFYQMATEHHMYARV